ncbi:hypothetical protein PILCRDRAFT_75454 [Piloderma croceum F 1598]|uniref:Uncharacterized protein n=1 Tax=Piloderma croceum (strain F 1598) TaxID=765440 RepID=A0A0C3FEZ1_PILCF|nr:hypothetical protein PILCRDRAFT_75454 [Piloderma croceum F 1598]
MSATVAQPRPPVSRRVSEYTAMLLAMDDIPMIHGIFTKVFVWILLVGFLVLPATFVNLQNKKTGTKGVTGDLIGSLQHLPIFIVGCACGGIGILGMCWFWYRWQANSIWICNNIFLPGAVNSLHGVVATVASNYGQNNKLEFVGTSKWTLIATAGLTVVCMLFFLFYSFIVSGSAKKKHDREYGGRKAGSRGEGRGFETKTSTNMS